MWPSFSQSTTTGIGQNQGCEVPGVAHLRYSQRDKTSSLVTFAHGSPHHETAALGLPRFLYRYERESGDASEIFNVTGYQRRMREERRSSNRAIGGL